jgi:lipid-A-disaccharide synthase
MGSKLKKVCILVGEPSGDMLGAHLVTALRKAYPKIEFMGTAGDRMEALGLKSLFPLKNLSIMGWLVSPMTVWKLWQHYLAVKAEILHHKPDVLVTIDFPGFNMKVVEKLRKIMPHLPMVHYVAPTVWAWRPGRSKKLASRVDHLLALFPFEPKYFTPHGLPTTFVGHPLIEEHLDKGNKKAFYEKHNLAKDMVCLCVLPGSRPSEIEKHLPIFRETVRLLLRQHPNAVVVLPTLPSIQDLIQTDDWPCRVILITDPAQKKDAYAASQMAIAASGTVALELALANVPMLISYRTSAFNAWLVRRFVKIRFACMVNILLDKEVIPELLQEKCTAEDIATAALAVLQNPDTQLKEFAKVKKLLSPPKDMPSDLAAKVIGEMVQ